MRRYIALISLLVVLVLSIPLGLVYATTFEYYIPITVNNSNAGILTNFTALVTINNSQLVDMGYLSASGLDTDISKGGDTYDHLVAESRLAFFVELVSGGGSDIYNYRLGVSPIQTDFTFMTGDGGNVTYSDHADLELGSDFLLEFTCFIDMSVNTTLVSKEDAFIVWAYGGDVVASILDSPPLTLTASGISTGEHLVAVWADKAYYYIYVE